MEAKRKSRSRYSADFKAEVLRACRQGKAPVTEIARGYGIHVGVVRRWLCTQAPAPALAAGQVFPKSTRSATGPGFVLLQLPPPAATCAPQDIRIELRRGDLQINISWPLHGAGDCVAWLRGWLP